MIFNTQESSNKPSSAGSQLLSWREKKTWVNLEHGEVVGKQTRQMFETRAFLGRLGPVFKKHCRDEKQHTDWQQSHMHEKVEYFQLTLFTSLDPYFFLQADTHKWESSWRHKHWSCWVVCWWNIQYPDRQTGRNRQKTIGPNWWHVPPVNGAQNGLFRHTKAHRHQSQTVSNGTNVESDNEWGLVPMVARHRMPSFSPLSILSLPLPPHTRTLCAGKTPVPNKCSLQRRRSCAKRSK